MNVSERTVKFHVSSLLAKFGVNDRMALTREVQLGRTPSNYQAAKTAPQTLFGYPVPPVGRRGAHIEATGAGRESKAGSQGT